VDDHAAKIHHQPAVQRPAFDAPLALVFFPDDFLHRFCQRIQHAVAGAGADHEIISKGYNIFDVDQQDVFAFLVLQGVDDGTCQVKCVQIVTSVV